MSIKYDPEKHHRRSIRLKNYDYSQPGDYFITICTKNNEYIFGDITYGKMQLNEYGKIAQDFWNEISIHFPGVKSGRFVVMPNHIHGIIIIMGCIDGNVGRGEVTSPLQPPMPVQPMHTEQPIPDISYTQPVQPTQPITPLQHMQIKKITLGKIIAYYKYQTTKLINEKRNSPGVPVWQRNYYEHIIRTDKDIIHIKEYIKNNPVKWSLDKENPDWKMKMIKEESANYIINEDELFDSIIETAEILVDKDLMASLQKSIKQIETGEIIPWEEVIKKLG